MTKSNSLNIKQYLHCGKCISEIPKGESPSSYSRYSIGWTRQGLQVWCTRHNCNIAHIDLMGNKVIVDSSIPK